MTTREIQDEILRLKKEKEVCILAHAYQNHEILEVADYMGDSFALSQQAAKTQEQTILMCGVRFMAETVNQTRKYFFPAVKQDVLWQNSFLWKN